MAPKIIAIEGPDGAGKSTIAREIAIKLSGMGYSCRNVHSPGATIVGKSITDIIYSDVAARKAVSFLYMADFAQLTYELKDSDLQYVIMDRHSCFSELVYSGIIENKELSDLMYDIYFKYMGSPLPDYTYILNVPYEVARNRVINSDISRINNFIDSKFVNDIEWGSSIANRYNMLYNYIGGTTVRASENDDDIKWQSYSPSDWVNEIYSDMVNKGVVV